MTRPGFPAALAALLLLPASLAAQYTGTWETTNNVGGTTVVTLQQTGDNVTGTLSGNGTTARLQGVIEEGLVVGAVTGGPVELRLWFEAELEDEGLVLTLISSLPDGSPNYDEMSTLLFDRRTAGGSAGAAAGGVNPGAAAGAGGMGGDGAIDDGTPLAREWVQHLAGNMATQMSRYDGGLGGGMTSRTDVHLCPNGEFAIQSNDQVGIDAGGAWGNARGNSATSGRWRILTQGEVAGIELRYGNGQVELYRLDYQNGQTLVDGQRWLVTPSNACGW